jgi:hypothetical protein
MVVKKLPKGMRDSRPIARLRKAEDLELHVKVTRVDGLALVNIRDYVPSSKQYGHGVVFPASLLPQVSAALAELGEQLGDER